MNALVEGMGSVTEFWGTVEPEDIDALYLSAEPTPERVLEMLDTTSEARSANDGKIATWLTRYIRETRLLKTLVRFVTGAEALHSSSPILVQFKDSTAMKPYPSSMTCFRILSVPRNFNSYFQLEKNFDFVLSDKKVWAVEDQIEVD